MSVFFLNLKWVYFLEEIIFSETFKDVNNLIIN